MDNSKAREKLEKFFKGVTFMDIVIPILIIILLIIIANYEEEPSTIINIYKCGDIENEK